MTKTTSAVIWCKGPATPWSGLTPLERFAIMFRPSVLNEIGSKFGICGPQNVVLDTSNPDDVWPDYCPTCGTDTNWDMEMFWQMHPEYKGVYDEE